MLNGVIGNTGSQRSGRLIPSGGVVQCIGSYVAGIWTDSCRPATHLSATPSPLYASRYTSRGKARSGEASIEEIRFLWKILHGLHPSTRQHRDSGRLPKRGVETCRLVPPSGQVASYRVQRSCF